MTKISKHDLDRAIQLRKDEIAKSAPERYTLALSYPGRHRFYDMVNGNKVGFTSTRNLDDGSHILMTENLTEGTSNAAHGVYERGLNSAI